MSTTKEFTQQRPFFALPFARKAKKQSIIPALSEAWFFLPGTKGKYFINGIVKGYDSAKDEYQILYLNPSDVPENYFFMDDLPADAMEYVCHEYRSIPASEVYHSYSDLCRKCKSLPTFQEADSAYMSYRDAISFICPTSFTAYLRAMTPYFLPRHLGMGVYFMNSEEE